MAALNAVHEKFIFNRRIHVLPRLLAEALPPENGSVLDVGCGDGQVALNLMELRPGLKVTGVDVMVRRQTHIPVVEYDGSHLPFEDKAFEYATIVDVLHHTENPTEVLREVARVVRKAIVIKDHLREGLLAGPTLRAMDWVGNRGHDVVLPYNYLRQAEWNAAFAASGLTIESWNEHLGLYAPPLSWFFERRLHFVARLSPGM
ncbi:MAG: methyltransferase domain-containing protein [Hyphomicrobiaceae bacterium]|nr:methyltransferase domain-containing protein [Hyphomicrobiaceae bacterium]